MKYSIWRYLNKNLTKLFFHNFLDIGRLFFHNLDVTLKLIYRNYRVLKDLLFYNGRHIKRIFTHIYKYNTSESYVNSLQKKIESAGLRGSKKVKGTKPSAAKTRKHS